MALGYQNPFYLKQAQRKQQSLYNGKVLLEKHDPPAVYDSEETLQLAQESRLKMKQLNKVIKPENYAKIDHHSRVFVSQMAKSREEMYFSNTSKTANVSKSISIPNKEFLDVTTPSVARKFLNEVKSTIVTLQRVAKQKMTLDIHNWSSSVHQEIHKMVKDEIFPLVNQVDARVQNFKIQFLKEAAKFVRDFKSLTKHKALEFEIDRLLRAIVSQDIMSILQNPTVVETSDLQTELEHTLNPLSQKLENENVKLEFQVLNYAKENAHLKTTYKNLFDSISVTRAQAKTIIDSLQDKLHDMIYKNAKLRAQLFDKTSEQKDTTKVTPFPKSKGLPKIDESHDLSKPVTSNSVPTPQESKVMKNDHVIAPGMFRINPFKISREEKYEPNKPIKASVRTKPITVSQPHVITKKDVNSDSNGLSSTGIDNTAKTRRPQPRRNTKNDRVPSASKSSYNKNKEVEVEVHPRNLMLSKNKKHISSECNNIKLAIRNDKSKVVCVMYSGCSKHMTGNLKLLINFIWKFLGTVRFGNDHVVAILDLEVAFRRKNCFVKNLEGVDLLKGNRTTNLYTINIHEMPLLLQFASWLMLLLPSHGKSKKASHPPKPVPNSKQRLHLLHMDLCGPMRVESINGKRLKDEAPEEIKTFLKKITVLLQVPVIIVRTDNDTEFKNQVLEGFFDSVGISHRSSSVRTP
ncbi:retrovirus-related pol polyprotein from transposon TNT 1-94 [Tanacetum coccineum]